MRKVIKQKSLFVLASIIFLISSCSLYNVNTNRGSKEEKITSVSQIPFTKSAENSKTINDCIVALKEKDYVKAVKLGKRAVVLNSNNFASYLCLSVAYAKTQQFNFAETSIDQAATLATNRSQKEEVEKAKQFILQCKNKD